MQQYLGNCLSVSRGTRLELSGQLQFFTQITFELCIFQACTDMIMPMCSTDEDMFETTAWSFKEYSDGCFKTFSVRPRSEQVPILEFGGKDIETASNIVFSNGLLDPWSGGGVLTNISSEITAILIPSGAHHVDLRSDNPLDSNDVKTARSFHEKQIEKWIKKYYLSALSSRPSAEMVE